MKTKITTNWIWYSTGDIAHRHTDIPDTLKKEGITQAWYIVDRGRCSLCGKIPLTRTIGGYLLKDKS